MPLPLDGIENKYSVHKCLPLGEGVFVCWMLSYLVRLSAMGCCFCSELYKAKFAMPYREGGCVSALSIEPKTAADAKVESYLKRFERRVEAAPPGQCPLTTVASYLETGANQTCGKCVPCRDGLPKLSELMRELANCQANNETLEILRALAQMIRDASDCAVGYEAAQATLDALDIFSEEVEAHLVGHSCTQGMGQSVPCETLCPAHVNVPGYIALVGEGRYADAIKLIRKDNPFPTACALVCEHPCEKRCRRILIDAPLNIRGIKKNGSRSGCCGFCFHARTFARFW